jgi:hypothetical protein
MRQSFRSKAATGTDTGMGMGGAITAVAATTTVGTAVAATTMVGDIIAIGGEQRAREGLYFLAASFIETPLAQWGYAIAGTMGLRHDGKAENEYATKEAAFEVAIAAASLALGEGHEVIATAPQTTTGAPAR